jgi:uncharacterized protein (TIGR02147 family)
MPVRIRDYLDYRAYLRDRYRELRARDRQITYQRLTAQVGLKSPGHITSIFKGDRNLTPRLIEPFADAFGLSGRNREYFRQLVAYNQAKTHQRKTAAFKRLTAFHRVSRTVLDPDVYRYFSRWYHPVVRELIALRPVTDQTAEALGRYATPRLSPAQVRSSVALLLELGLIRRRADGVLVRGDRAITTGEGWRSVTIHTYQRAILDQAKKALEATPREERDISTITVSVSADRFAAIQEKIRALREELRDMASAETSADRVYQCTFAVFPCTDRVEDTDHDS